MGGAHLKGMEGSESRIGGYLEGDPPRATPQLAAAAQIRAAWWAGWASGALPAAQLPALGFLRPPSPEKALKGFSNLGREDVCGEGGLNRTFSSPGGDYGPQRHCAFVPSGGKGTACEYPVCAVFLAPFFLSLPSLAVCLRGRVQ